MIELQNVDKSFQGTPLFHKVSFAVGRGERCALVGRNGSGKTTLFQLILGRDKPDRGSLHISKDYKLGYLQQHIHFTQMTLLEEAALGLAKEDRDKTYLVESLLSGFGFSQEDMQKSPTLFSGGFQLRIQLVKVLVANPDCLLLDEPTNFLDILSIQFLTKFLNSWKKECLLISHDRAFLDATCTHTLGLHRQKAYKVKGDTQKLFSLILQEEELHEKTRQNLEKKKAHLESFVKRFGAKASKASQAESRRKMLAKMPVLSELAHLYQLDFHFHFKPFPGQKFLQAEKLTFSYGDTPLIHDLSLEVEKGERIAIIGKNGEGKSTLLRLLFNDLQPISGSIRYAEKTRIGYFGQSNIERLQAALSVEEEIAQANSALTQTEVRAICGQVCFPGDAALKKIAQLSGGERSRVLIGKILATPCNLILLDEPTNHLDIESVEALLDAIDRFPGAVVMITHSELILDRLDFTKLLVCHPGRQEVFLGSYESFLEKKGWEEELKNLPPSKTSSLYHEEKRKQRELNLQMGKRKKEKELLESKIEHLEEIMHKESEALAHASREGNGQRIKELSLSLAHKQKELDRLYLQWDAL